jgi:hypothetical protein
LERFNIVISVFDLDGILKARARSKARYDWVSIAVADLFELAHECGLIGYADR